MRRHVYFYTLLDRQFDVAADLLSGDASGWLPPPAESAGEGESWHVDLTADGAMRAGVATMPALVRVGEPSRFDDHLLRAIRWQARTAERLFPVLEADVDLRRLDGSGCHLSLTGTYRPPLSVVGGMGDLLLGHRVAEACVRRFVLDIASRLAVPASGR